MVAVSLDSFSYNKDPELPASKMVFKSSFMRLGMLPVVMSSDAEK